MHSIRHRMHSIRHRISSRQRHSSKTHWRRKQDPLCYFICMCMCVGGCQSSCEFAHRRRKKPTHSHMRRYRGKQTHAQHSPLGTDVHQRKEGGPQEPGYGDGCYACAQHSPLGTDVHQRTHACIPAHASMQGARVCSRGSSVCSSSGSSMCSSAGGVKSQKIRAQQVRDSSSRLRRRRQEWASTSTRALGVAVAVCALVAPFRRYALKSSSARPYTREHACRCSICVRTGLAFRVEGLGCALPQTHIYFS